MANYSLSELADQDLEDISEYTTRNYGRKQTFDYKASIKQAARTAANFPSIGRPYTTKKGNIFQRYNVGRHAMFYQPTEAGIFIVRVLHLMMDFDRHLDS